LTLAGVNETAGLSSPSITDIRAMSFTRPNERAARCKAAWNIAPSVRRWRKLAGPITVHVDWTSVAERGEESGLSLVGFTDQHHFITGLLTRRTPQESERRALQTLLHPELLGTRFQYLALGRNVPARPLSGYRYAGDARKMFRNPGF